jgi:hypothetical protein
MQIADYRLLIVDLLSSVRPIKIEIVGVAFPAAGKG